MDEVVFCFLFDIIAMVIIKIVFDLKKALAHCTKEHLSSCLEYEGIKNIFIIKEKNLIYLGNNLKHNNFPS